MSGGPDNERQGAVGDLDKKPKGELVELLGRQLKLKANKKFIQSLPDKGKRIGEFIQKLDTAIARHEEMEQTAEVEQTAKLLSAVKLEFQVKQVEMTFDKAEDLTNEVVTSTLTARQVWNETEKDQYVLSKINVQSGVKENSEVCIENQKSSHEGGTVLEKEQATLAIQNSKVPTKNGNSLDSLMDHQSTMDIKREGKNRLELHNATNVKDRDFDKTTELLADRFGKVSLTENEHRKVPKKVHEEPTLISDVKFTDNPFWTLHQVKKNPHYVDVLQHRAMNPLVKKAQFKPNHPISGSPGSSPDHSPGRSELKLSSAERRLRNRKHLDDITAARLPLLYYSPVQLLSFEESAELQISQKQKYELSQAKQAAERLTERMNIKMVKFDLQHENVTAHPGFRDHGDSSSSEDDLI
ncbi:protein GRINL1A [Rhinoraja longicauda]